MSQSFAIALIGATGLVGETLIELLEEREFPVSTLHLLASAESAGQSFAFRGKNLRVRDVAEFDFAQVQIAFFAAGEAVTRSFAPRARAAGCALIDLSGALLPDEAPRIVPEVNAGAVAALKPPYVLASPLSPVVMLACVLAPLAREHTLQRLTVTAALAISQRGREGVTELARQTAELLNARPLEPRLFDRQVAFNLLAQVGQVDGEGQALLERRLAAELRQVLALPELKVSASCVQAPVFFGDSLSVSLLSAEALAPEQVRATLACESALEVVEEGDYPTAVGDAVGQDAIYVGRLRQGLDDATELNLWITSDNVRKGAALNAVQIAELLIKHYL